MIHEVLKSQLRQRKVVLIYILLASVTLILCWPVVGFNFINYDDGTYVTENAHVQAGITTKSIVWAFSSIEALNWHPITWLSHMLDYQIYGLHAGGHHFTNVFFHVVNTVLLFGLLRKFTGVVWPSAFVAALFAWHPMHVESVAWVSERKDVLSTFFALLTIWSYWFYVQVPNWRRYGVTLLAFACGLMAKPMLVTLPLLLLLLDFWPLDRVGRLKAVAIAKTKQSELQIWMDLVIEKLPLFILAIASSCVTYWAQVIQPEYSGQSFTLYDHVANALNSYICYISKLIWPTHLSVFYPYHHHLPFVQTAVTGLILAIFFFIAYRYRRSRPYLIAGWIWFFVALLPVIGLVQVGSQSMADRYSYIPSIGLFLALTWAVTHMFGPAGWGRWILGIGATFILTGCLIATSIQLKYWDNSVDLFTHAIEVTQDNAIAHSNLGEALLEQGKADEGLEHLNEALRIAPNMVVTRNNKGELLYQQGKFTEAATEFNAALALQPGFDLAHNGLGKALLALGKTEAAETQFRAAVKYAPDSDANRLNLGLFLAHQGRVTEAVAQYEAALRLAPSSEVENAWGSALQTQGKTELAIEHYRVALKINPDFAEANCNLGAILTGQRKFDEAVQYLTKAIKAKPGFAEAHYNLGNVLINQGKIDEASRQYVEAVHLKPDYMEAHFNLGNVMFQQHRWAEALTNYAVAAKLQPNLVETQVRMAIVFRFMGNDQAAIDHFREALRIDPHSVATLQALAWVLATASDSRLRNGTEAVKLALSAVSSADSPVVWDTLAAAYAEDGQFNNAVESADKAIKLAIRAGKENLVMKFQGHLRLFEQHQPFHESIRGAKSY